MSSPAGVADAAELLREDSVAFAASAGVHRICVDGRPLLYDERRQQLLQLNDTADLIWRRLARGEPPARAAEAMVELGLDAAEAARFVADAAQSWMLGGQLLPIAALEALARPPTAVRTLGLDELAVEVAFYGDAIAAACDRVFGHLYGPTARPPRRVAVVAWADSFFLFLDRTPVSATRADGLAPELKAILTDLYMNGVEGAFLTHGALLVRDGAGLIVSGAPGAGKTTLALALASAGWAYGGDDIVRIDPDGLARGAPFAAAAKSGAWALLRHRWPDLEALPVWLRADGQRARYLLPSRLADRRPLAPTAIVVLARRDGVRAELQPIEPLEALTALLDSAYAARWRLDAAALRALAQRVEAATCRRLAYSDLDDAVALIDGLADV